MAYVPVPKDLTKVKTKVAFNLTKRQLIFFAAALALGLPLFFLLKNSAGTSLAAMAMIVVMLPCFLFAMYAPAALTDLLSGGGIPGMKTVPEALTREEDTDHEE